MKKLLTLLIFSLLVLQTNDVFGASPKNEKRPLRLVYWNIQNGMWDGQIDNYTRFVDWVKSKKPDICVWAEAQSIFKYGTDTPLDSAECYLVKNWDVIAERYGHKYVYVGAHRDDYPQVVTSKYPIENVQRIIGSEPDSVVTHGASWSKIQIGKNTINVVTLHTWPQKFAFRAEDKEASKANNEGDKYRRMEIEYICTHTVSTSENAKNEMWMMMGDFNSRSRVDNEFYEYPEDDTRFLVHDYIAQNTPYIDVIAAQHPGEFHPTMSSGSRIDFVYCTPALYQKVKEAHIGHDYYTEPVKVGISNFYYPSDHRPIIVDFDLK